MSVNHIVDQVVRRAVQVHASAKDDPEGEFAELPAWGLLSLAATSVFFFCLLSMVDYTYGHVIAALTMVESPAGIVLEHAVPTGADVKLHEVNKVASVDAEMLFIKQRPITAKFRTAIRHLRARAGALSRFRGISAYLVHSILLGTTTNVLNAFWLPAPLAAIAASVVLARLRMSWTHIVITESSPLPWFRRLPSLASWKRIAAPTALLAFTEQITVGLPVVFFYAMNLDKIDQDVLHKMSCADRRNLVTKIIAVLGLALFTAFAIVIPAMVTLTRMQASLLSDEDETIVPFDRSFGGKVGESGTVGMLDAWKTFDWAGRVRLLKLYVKVCAMQVAIMFLFIASVTVQLMAMTDREGLMKSMKAYKNALTTS